MADCQFYGLQTIAKFCCDRRRAVNLDQMLTYCAAVLLVLALRVACVGGMRLPFKVGLQLISGLWLGIASWTVGALVRAWVPVWQMLFLGLALSAIIAALPVNIRVQARAVADFVAVAALWPLSVIPVDAASVIVAAVTFTAAGFALDSLSRRMPPPIQWRLFALPAVLLVLLGVGARYMSDFGLRLLVQDPFSPLRFALAVPNPGARAYLESGTGAWILRAPGDSPRGTVQGHAF